MRKIITVIVGLMVVLTPYAIAIAVGMTLGFSVVYANPECYQTKLGVVRFHPAVFFVAMSLAGFLISKFKRIRKSVGIIVTLAIVSFLFGIIAPAVYYSSASFIIVGLIIFLAGYVFSKGVIVQNRREAKKLAGVDTPFTRY